MVAVAYPTTLPGPLPGSFEPRPRRGASTIDGPLQQRARQRDAAGMTSQYTYVYTPHQMAIWREWYRTTLLDGRRWFAHALPGRGGMVPRVVKYQQVQQQLLGMGIYRVTASFEQRGAALLPLQGNCEPNVIFQAAFNSSVAYDISASLLGNGTRLGADGSMSSGGFSFEGNSGSMVNLITQGLYWESATLNPAIGQGRTYEFIVDIESLLSGGAGAIDFFQLSINGTSAFLLFSLNGGGPGVIGKLAIQRSFSGSAVTWHTAASPIYADNIHLAAQLRPKDGSPGALSCDVYLGGVKLFTQDWTVLTGMTTTQMLWFGGTQFQTPSTDFLLQAARVSDIARYSADFAPPASFPLPCGA